MNNQKVYSIFDKKLGAYMQPWFSVNDQVAARTFADLVRDPGTPVAAHPEDYSLHRVGEWSAPDGELKGFEPVSICSASSFVKE